MITKAFCYAIEWVEPYNIRMSARELYESTVRALPPLERLRLAAFILDELSASKGAGLEFEDEWSDEDLGDLAHYSSQYLIRQDGDNG